MPSSTAQTDYYALLQVPPTASSDEIAAAYVRLADLYSPERTAEAAPDLQALAADKRAQLDSAFHTLAQPQQRAAYDRAYGRDSATDLASSLDSSERFAATGAASPTHESLDYRPLPPAKAQERGVVSGGDVERTQRGRVARRQGVVAWLIPFAVAAGTLALLLLLILSGVRTTGGAAAIPTPPARIGGQELKLPFTANQIEQFRAAAQTSNTSQTWTALGNALFDNLQMLRENVPQSPQYRGALNDWLQSAQAYERSLSLQEDATVRSDRAVALLNYGLDAPDSQRVQEAVTDVERGIAAGTTAPRALLNYGTVLVQISPPRIEEAAAQWRKIIEAAPQSGEAQRAQALLQAYGQ